MSHDHKTCHIYYILEACRRHLRKCSIITDIDLTFYVLSCVAFSQRKYHTSRLNVFSRFPLICHIVVYFQRKACMSTQRARRLIFGTDSRDCSHALTGRMRLCVTSQNTSFSHSNCRANKSLTTIYFLCASMQVRVLTL